MSSPVFENAFLLQSLGWAIANSFWQTGILWLLYLVVTGIDKKLPALVKHHLGLVLLSTSFIWFLATIIGNYRILSDGSGSVPSFLGRDWLLSEQFFNYTLPLLSGIYLVLLFFYLARFIKNLAANRFLQTEGLTRAPLEFRLFIQKTACHLGIKKDIRIWFSTNVDVPSVTGFLKPVILLPAAIITQLSMRQTEAILLHELAHIKRNDCLVNLAQSVLELILFFNPFAILLSNSAKKERENCCDDWVLNFQYDHHEYAGALLLLEEQRQNLKCGFALAATNNGKKNLLLRVKRLFIVDQKTDYNSLQKLKIVSLSVFLLVTIVTIPPTVTNKQSIHKSLLFNKKEQLSTTTETITENKTKINFKTQTVIPFTGSARKQVVPYRKQKRWPVKPAPDYYVDAFVNEELLTPASSIEPIIKQVVEKAVKGEKVFVKVEEQQSGNPQTHTYYFEVHNKDGNTAVKPLIIINKMESSIKKIILQPAANRIDTIRKMTYRKRITS